MKVFGFAGWSGSGKTTLIEKLIPRFTGATASRGAYQGTSGTWDVGTLARGATATLKIKVQADGSIG